jgi:hypothetical protein
MRFDAPPGQPALPGVPIFGTTMDHCCGYSNNDGPSSWPAWTRWSAASATPDILKPEQNGISQASGECCAFRERDTPETQPISECSPRTPKTPSSPNPPRNFIISLLNNISHTRLVDDVSPG